MHLKFATLVTPLLLGQIVRNRFWKLIPAVMYLFIHQLNMVTPINTIMAMWSALKLNFTNTLFLKLAHKKVGIRTAKSGLLGLFQEMTKTQDGKCFGKL